MEIIIQRPVTHPRPMDVRLVSEDGELLRELVLDPDRDYQARARSS
jgi:hypothetical protein